MKYYLAANITETDDGDDGSSSGDGDDGDEMNEFQTYTFNGDVMMSDNFVGIVGKTYTVRLFAENCFGNSTVAIYSFSKYITNKNNVIFLLECIILVALLFKSAMQRNF